MLAVLSLIDIVIIFDDKVPNDAISQVYPDIRTKGGATM